MSDNLPPVVANSEIQKGIDDFASLLRKHLENLEPRVRLLVKEEIEKKLKILRNGICSSGVSISSEPRYLELHFSCNVLETVWTAEPIKGEGNSSILVTLIDPLTRQIVKFGPEASGKVEIFILKGSFESDDWTEDEFSKNIIREMNGKKILKGNACLELKEGIGALGDLSILHNKIWKRVSKLRLGARLMDSIQNIKVKEAKTQTFTMKDKRMKGNGIKGAEVVSLMDNVWCLKNIGQHRPIVDRLTARGITTIKDFLSLYFVHSEELRKILGRGLTERKLKATIDHCLKCKKLEKRYLSLHTNDSEENYGVVFTEVFNVLGMLKGGQFIPFDQLPETLKCNALNRVKDAFDNEEEGIVWDETMYPLVSPTAFSNGHFSNGPFSSYSMMDDDVDVASEATIGTDVFSGGEEGEVDRNASIMDMIAIFSSNGLENGHDLTTGEEIFSSDDHGCAMVENDPNNIPLLPVMMNMNEINWNFVLRIPSFNNEDQQYLL